MHADKGPPAYGVLCPRIDFHNACWPSGHLRRSLTSIETATRTRVYLPPACMPLNDYTHVIIDSSSGDALAVVSHVDELEDGRRFGLVRWLEETMEPTYLWLRSLPLLAMADATPDVRAQLAEIVGHPGRP